MSNASNSAKIAELNDQFRQSFIGGKIHITQGVQQLSEDSLQRIFHEVRNFDDFNEENDPWNEHDFGSIKIGTNMIFWKIDLYDLDMENYSSNPTDPEVTVRVLTIMKANEN